MNKENATSPRHSGRGGTENGFTLIELVIVTVLIAILAAIAIPMYFSFIQKAKETAALAYLGKAKKAQAIFYMENAAGLYSASFDELETTGMIEPATGAAARVDGEYQMTLSADIVDGNPVWSITAAPLSADPEARHFYVDHTGIVRTETGAAAGPASPPLK